jgi:hypothetical protein
MGNWRAKSPYDDPIGTVAQIGAKALGSLFIASYDSQGYDEGDLEFLQNSLANGRRR